MRTVELRTLIGADPSSCFDLSLSVDAHRESMNASRERAVAGVTSGQMALGDVVTWRARHFGVPFTMTSAITAYDTPHQFIDEQVTGPFSVWWHEHTFEDAPDGGTVMTDRVRFQAPLGPLGLVAETVVLNRYLPRLLEQRNAWLRMALEAE